MTMKSQEYKFYMSKYFVWSATSEIQSNAGFEVEERNKKCRLRLRPPITSHQPERETWELFLQCLWSVSNYRSQSPTPLW